MPAIAGVTEAEISDFKVRGLLSESTLAKLAGEFSSVRIRHLCFDVEASPGDFVRILVGHKDPEEEAAGAAVLEVNESAVFGRVAKALGITTDAEKASPKV